MPFSDIVGHDRNISLLKRILTSGKMAHAYLFAGVDGTGKKRVAQTFIAAAFCGKGDACGICQSCVKIAGASHPDLHFLEPDGTFIKIDQVRNLQKELSYRPYQSVRKACIIDGADRLNPSAGNALLKTLEEPPGNALMILIATSIENVLPTIRSRCQGVLFQGLSEQLICDYLISQGISNENAQVSATLADGSMAKAISLSNLDFLSDRSSFLQAVNSVKTSEIGKLFAISGNFDKDREQAILSLDLLLSFWRDLLHLCSGSGEIINQDMFDLLKCKAEVSSPQKVMDQITMITDTRKALQRNANVRLAMDVMLLNLAE